jgi:hypothetical protein
VLRGSAVEAVEAVADSEPDDFARTRGALTGRLLTAPVAARQARP